MGFDTIYMLDLCILAYQLHAQTLVLIPDPYGEQMQESGDQSCPTPCCLGSVA